MCILFVCACVRVNLCATLFRMHWCAHKYNRNSYLKNRSYNNNTVYAYVIKRLNLIKYVIKNKIIISKCFAVKTFGNS